MIKALETLAEDPETRGGIDLSECFIDGTFMVAQKGANELRGKGTKLMVADDAFLPFADYAEGAAGQEVRLVTKTLQTSFVSRQPSRLIGDKAHDSDSAENHLGFVHLGCIVILLRIGFAQKLLKKYDSLSRRSATAQQISR